ncbi:hypothetical protein KAR91_33890 [Candidatus Pacearchaeota archaeon]|nr:hypothetical protein [Candidatus Pacearchaeota archaeon]
MSVIDRVISYLRTNNEGFNDFLEDGVRNTYKTFENECVSNQTKEPDLRIATALERIAELLEPISKHYDVLFEVKYVPDSNAKPATKDDDKHTGGTRLSDGSILTEAPCPSCNQVFLLEKDDKMRCPDCGFETGSMRMIDDNQ